MIVYRFVHPKYANDISGTGAKLMGGRWNPIGVAVLYTSENISLGLLEVIANTYTLDELTKIQLLEIEIPSPSPFHEIKISQLKDFWWEDFEYSQWLGAEILKSSKVLFIKCPSAIVEKEHNILLNPTHPLFKKIKVNTKNDFRFDERLFKL